MPGSGEYSAIILAMKRWFFLIVVLLCLPLSSRACLNDRDSLEAEAVGIPQTIVVIAGRFARNPELFYEMRLSRVTKEIAAFPHKLELYDDAAVACDRLHRDGEAIVWMKRKAAEMARQKKTGMTVASQLKEHQYRYLANLGTFYAHNWLRSGANRKKMEQLALGRNLIVQAIKIKPDAHFGREKYQLQAIEWMLHPPKWKPDADFPSLPSFSSRDNEPNRSKAVEGIAGLIVLGDAWQSVDAFNALSLALLKNGMLTSVAYMARLRARELARAGKKSLLPGAPTGEGLARLMSDRDFEEDIDNDQVESQFQKLRAEADHWQALRTAYMTERLSRGKHPDTDKDFWKDWSEPSPPSLYTVTTGQVMRPYILKCMALGGSLIVVALLIFRAKRRARNLAL